MKYLTLSLLLIACGSPDSDPAPKASLAPVETILVSSTDVKAVAVCKSSAPIRGICWGQNPDPNKSNSWATGDTVEFQTRAREVYYIRAFAQNGAGLSYGKSIMFKAICPSALAGTVNYVTSSILSAGYPCSAVSGTVTFISLGDGKYSISDASFGVFACAWGDSPATGIKFLDTCGKFTIEGTDQYGSKYLWDYSIDGDELTVVWSNDFGDSATTILTKIGGWD